MSKATVSWLRSASRGCSWVRALCTACRTIRWRRKGGTLEQGAAPWEQARLRTEPNLSRLHTGGAPKPKPQQTSLNPSKQA